MAMEKMHISLRFQSQTSAIWLTLWGSLWMSCTTSWRVMRDAFSSQSWTEMQWNWRKQCWQGSRCHTSMRNKRFHQFTQTVPSTQPKAMKEQWTKHTNLIVWSSFSFPLKLKLCISDWIPFETVPFGRSWSTIWINNSQTMENVRSQQMNNVNELPTTKERLKKVRQKMRINWIWFKLMKNWNWQKQW